MNNVPAAYTGINMASQFNVLAHTLFKSSIVLEPMLCFLLKVKLKFSHLNLSLYFVGGILHIEVNISRTFY